MMEYKTLKKEHVNVLLTKFNYPIPTTENSCVLHIYSIVKFILKIKINIKTKINYN